jgi:hypothetical protein
VDNTNLSLGTTFIGFDTAITHDCILKQSPTLHPETTNSIEKVGLFKFGTTDIGSIDVSPFQISFGKVTRREPTVPEIAIGQVGIGEVDTTQVRSKQNSPRQINSSQIGFFGETDINKVSFSSGISFEQLINSNINGWSSELPSFKTPVFAHPPNTKPQHVFSRTNGQPIHNNFSNLLTNIYSTAQNLWQTTTPINLTFAITDLPSGQLAEATITGYNPNGTPNTDCASSLIPPYRGIWGLVNPKHTPKSPQRRGLYLHPKS